MIILAVESSCDETAVALVQDGRTVLADCIASSMEMHKLYGGVVPEIASRKHIEVISALADQALNQAGLTRKDIDATTSGATSPPTTSPTPTWSPPSSASASPGEPPSSWT